MSDLTPHQQAIAYLVAAYPVPSWEPETLRLYAAEVEDLPAKAVQRAVRDWVRTAAERPSVAELRRDSIGVVKRARLEAKRKAIAAAEGAHALEPADPVEVRKLLRDLGVRLRQRQQALPAPTPPPPEEPQEPAVIVDLARIRAREQRKAALLAQVKP